jgi:hypothetical protein
MPIFEKHGCRTNNSKNSGLCRLLLTYNLGLDSSIQDFSGSSKKGRIVVINEGREVK